VRPENVVLRQGGVPVAVELVEPLGSETLVHGRMTDGTPLLCKLPGAVPVPERVEVGFEEAALHLFDAATGQRL
jgi:sn-glycerol 3-phosphate transport system ATP-binding protein